jgi:flagellar motor switch protein FliN/FliY
VRADDVLDVRVRVSVELGRARLPTAELVGLAPGAVVDLDRAAEEPVDVYVNGLHYGTGRLVAVDGEWAVRLETIALEQPSSADTER